MRYLLIIILLLYQCLTNNYFQVSAKTKVQAFIPSWLSLILDSNHVKITEKEQNSLSLLDIDGDKITDALIIVSDSLLFIDKKGNILNLTKIKDEENEILGPCQWVDFWYVDDALNPKEFPYVLSQGQVLILGKESSGVIAVYFNNGFHWVSYD